MFRNSVLLVLSFFIAAFGQGFWVPVLGTVAAAVGYGIFWFAMLSLFPGNRGRFWLSSIWFSLVQGIHLSWMTSTEYMGPLILIVYACLIFLMGLQFGCLVFFFSSKKEETISLSNCLGLAGCWVILEWARLFFFTGFTWNPLGLSLTDSRFSLQFASLFGVYGLSFWVMFVNAFGLYALKSKKRRWVWASLTLFPYLYGMGQLLWVDNEVPKTKEISVALVQTALLPEEKDRLPKHYGSYIHPLNQWERILDSLESGKKLDLIVLPESVVSMSAYRPYYSMKNIKEMWVNSFGREALSDLPDPKPPFVVMEEIRREKKLYATNAYIAQALANHLHADVIAGFDDADGNGKYNAAFCFKSGSPKVERYEKRMLAPVAEYMPLSYFSSISEFLSDQFGIGDSFTFGGEAKLFFSSFPIGVSICLEETYSHLVRDLRLKGAEFLVNISNDVWFPRSMLPWHHFQHALIRAAENGVGILRACNTGITGAIDCCGRVIEILPPSEETPGVLYLSFPIQSFQTLYSFWGDRAILACSVFFVLLSFFNYQFQRRLV